MVGQGAHYVLLPDDEHSDSDGGSECDERGTSTPAPAVRARSGDGRHGCLRSPYVTRALCAIGATAALAMLLALAAAPGVLLYGTTVDYDKDWWKSSVIYQIYPRSFQDSDGDGVGDLNGIISRLDYLQRLGVGAIWLSPIYDSPMKDFGYDVRDYRMVDATFGTMDDFDRLVQEVHNRSMRLIMDFVPNHSSDEHEWFVRSVRRVHPYTDYYVWHDGGGYNETVGRRNAPNNWLSVFGNSSWQWHPHRQQYYYHRFLISQPDLNYYNQHVQREMIDVLSFWMDRGVDGFRIDAVPHLAEDLSFADEPLDPAHADSPTNSYEHLKHIYTLNQPLTFDTLKRWADHFRQYSRKHKRYIFSVAEMDWLTSIKTDMGYYATGVDLPFNFDLVGALNANTTVGDVRRAVQSWMEAMPAGKWPNWVVGSHDANRLASRLRTTAYTDVANALLLLLPGTPTAYYGDEIGMTDIYVSYEDTKDPFGKKWGPLLYGKYSRDPQRSPMQWSGLPNAGFTNASVKPWLPLAHNYTEVNVRRQWDKTDSHLSKFRQLLELRKRSVFETHGDNCECYGEHFGRIAPPVFAFGRIAEGERASYVVLLNFDRRMQRASEVVLHTDLFGSACQVAFAAGPMHRYKEGEQMSNGVPLTLHAGDVLVLRVDRAPRRSS